MGTRDGRRSQARGLLWDYGFPGGPVQQWPVSELWFHGGLVLFLALEVVAPGGLTLCLYD